MQGGGTKRVYGQFHMLQDCSLDRNLSDGVVSLVYVGCKELSVLIAFLNAVNPNLKMSVVVGKDFVGIVVYYWLESHSVLRKGCCWLCLRLDWLVAQHIEP